jgi:hypothetical protein
VFNRICVTVSLTGGRGAPMSRRHHSAVTVGLSVAPRDRIAPNWFATTEAL